MIESYSQTKILVTIGPATSDKETLKTMFREGVDACRLNFSHSTHEEHLKVIRKIEELNKELETEVAIMADLQGPKIRIGEIQNGFMMLKEGQELHLTTIESMVDEQHIFINYKVFPKDVKVGDLVLIDDGKLRFEVTETDHKSSVRIKTLNGGKLSSKKGVNLPDTRISMPSLTEKDLRDAHFALDHDVDWIALSFVRSVDDIKHLRNLINEKGKNTSIVAKIEKPEALKEIDEIISESDAIMVARGDLGVEVSFDQVPVIQKRIVQKSVEKARPVIIATQMMESMTEHFRPTRAEANDVANAVMDGADALMLSAETSVGKYPVEAIRNMERIISFTENNGYRFYRKLGQKDTRRFLPDSICDAARRLADKTQSHAIICFTNSGYTAYRMASHRPKAPIFVFTNNKTILRRMSLVWGVRAYYFDLESNTDDCIQKTTECLKEKGLLQAGNVVIHLASMPLQYKGMTNMMKMSYV